MEWWKMLLTGPMALAWSWACWSVSLLPCGRSDRKSESKRGGKFPTCPLARASWKLAPTASATHLRRRHGRRVRQALMNPVAVDLQREVVHSRRHDKLQIGRHTRIGKVLHDLASGIENPAA